MSLLLDCNHLSSLCKEWYKLPKRGLNCCQRAMEKNQWSACATDFIIHIEPVHGSIAAFDAVISFIGHAFRPDTLPFCSSSVEMF
ncbi:hypothetical protein MSHOH_0911 [Methanosarcina horonobensis HB-1 = JCM 15518]|uniref:Uncharacterized protein n=1 Tax=Methanosarcina horonobensis HB-1 = JCM 15518 TaxID=1434110 RepID=A0A0E3S7M4_9EURY|nr:hypothetical protein MSHOH_0911 [Methanosarcina horonobensis HB-1 = JCM 15518]